MPARRPGTLSLLLRPSMFVLHVPAVAGVVLAFLLGLWQLEAWQEQRRDRAAELADADPVPLADVLGADDPFPGDAVGQPVRLAGRWLPEDTLYVADRSAGGRTGFWMVTPVTTCGSAGDEAGCTEPSVVPVVLGWTADPGAAPAPPSGGVALVGWLQPAEGGGDPDPDPADDVLPRLRTADLLQRIDRDLYGGYVILDEPAAVREALDAVTPDSLPPAPTFTALRNLLYAVEWWLFGLFGIFLWWRWSRDEVAAARVRHEAAAGGAPDPGVSPVSGAAEDAEGGAEARIPSGP